MNRFINPWLMLMPAEAMGPALVLMIMVGGMMVMVGARRAGLALVYTAIALPFITVVAEILMNEVFTAVPDGLVQPLAWGMMGIAYLTLAGMLMVMLFGQKASGGVLTILLADAIKGLLRLLFWWPLMLLWVPAVAYFAWRVR